MPIVYHNLFGEESAPPTKIIKRPLGRIQQIKQYIGYRTGDGSENTCRNCVNRFIFGSGGKGYHKCRHIGNSHCETTDIRLKNTCDRFKHLIYRGNK